MQRVMGSLLLIIILSSLVAASSVTIGFTIKDSQIQIQDLYKTSASNFSDYGFYLIGVLFVVLGGFFIFKSKRKDMRKKTSTKKKVQAKKKKYNSKK